MSGYNKSRHKSVIQTSEYNGIENIKEDQSLYYRNSIHDFESSPLLQERINTQMEISAKETPSILSQKLSEKTEVLVNEERKICEMEIELLQK